MENTMQFVSCKNLKVAISIEYHSQELHDAYLPFNVLFLIKKGKLHLKEANQESAFGKNKTILVKRYTKGHYYKTFTKKEGCAKMYAIAFQDPLIRQVISKINTPKEELIEEEDVKSIQEIWAGKNHDDLMHFFDNLFDAKSEINESDVQVKIVATLFELLSENPELLKIFRKVSLPVKADLRIFMQYHYLEDISVGHLAKLSGRSQATFYRDFREIFDSSPHKWILRKRLLDAKSLLEVENKSASQVYLEVGFKDLAHFSKSFKKEFGIAPSLVSKK